MNKPKAILFDMGDTLIEYTSYNPLQGNKKLLEYAYNPNEVKAEEVQELATELGQELYGKRDFHNIEINLRSFQRLLFEMCNITFDLSPLELENLFSRSAFEKRVMKGVIAFLDYLETEGIRTGILSNSSFSEEALIQELKDCGINHRFEFLISSMEYCIRKPDKRLFEIALIKFGLEAEDVWYIGNSFKYDVIGANNAMLKPVWLNREGLEPIEKIDYIEFNSYDKLLEDLKQMNDYERKII